MKISSCRIPESISPSSNAGILRTCAILTISACLAWIGNSSTASASPGYRSQRTGDEPAEAVYKRHCSVCHGDRGNGGSKAKSDLIPPPRDFSEAANLTRETMVSAVTNGKPGTAMMGWKTRLSDNEINSVVDYIRNRFMLVALDPRVALGRGVYGHFCQVCHGDRGQGVKSAVATDTPRDLTVPKAQAGLTRERMIASVSRGRHGSVKAGFADRLSPEHIGAVVDYVREVMIPSLPKSPSEAQAPSTTQTAGTQAANTQASGSQQQPTAQALSELMRQPLPDGLKGNAQLGERFYMTNCATCHGIQGNAQGPRAYFINPKVRNFWDDYSRTTLNRPRIFLSVSKGRLGTEMPAWEKVLTKQEIANVTEFVFQAFIQKNVASKASAK